jgi:hypothetical protein
MAVDQTRDLGGYKQVPQTRTCLQRTLEGDLVFKGHQSHLIAKAFRVEVKSRDRH